MDTSWWSVSSPGYSNQRVVFQPDLGSHPPSNVPVQITTLAPQPPERHQLQVQQSNFNRAKSGHWNGQAVHSAQTTIKQEQVVLPIKCAQCEFWTTSDQILKAHVNEVHLISVETQTCSSGIQTSKTSLSNSPKNKEGPKKQFKKSPKFACEQCAYKCGKNQFWKYHQFMQILGYPSESKAIREVANLTERKNLHTPIYSVKEFVCLSVCLWY